MILLPNNSKWGGLSFSPADLERTSTKIKAVLLGTLLLTFLLPVDVKAIIHNIVSDRTWTVSDTNGNSLGFAQNVCLDQNSPSPCPGGATRYGYAYNAWTANLSSIPGATWIWAPNITGATTQAANAEFIFQRVFYLCGPPRGGTISVAADNSAEVLLNGKLVLSSASASALSSVSIPATDLAQGMNTIEVRAKNAANPSDCGSGEYRCNPAGMVLGASFEDALTQYPTCPGGGKVGDAKTAKITSNGQPCLQTLICACISPTYANWTPVSTICPPPNPTCTEGTIETLPCPAGQNGSQTRTCQSGIWVVTSSTCTTQTAKCTGTNGATFLPGQSETVSCNPSWTYCKEGNQSRTCQDDGSWGNTSACILPLANAGDWCGSTSKGGECRTCPGGTTCKKRKLGRVCEGWWIFKHCYDTYTTDWYCDPVGGAQITPSPRGSVQLSALTTPVWWR